jgi:hypothetical protein
VDAGASGSDADRQICASAARDHGFVAEQHHLRLAPDYGPYLGRIDDRVVTSAAQIPVSDASRARVEDWWEAGYGESDVRPDLDDQGYENLTRELADLLQEELGPAWRVSWEL